MVRAVVALVVLLHHLHADNVDGRETPRPSRRGPAYWGEAGRFRLR